MEFLVTGKPINVTGDFHNWCVAYRRYMADQMYFWRCLPRPGFDICMPWLKTSLAMESMAENATSNGVVGENATSNGG
ncbi:hypothetical protein R6Q57_006558 [Mikania cordata]